MRMSYPSAACSYSATKRDLGKKRRVAVPGSLHCQFDSSVPSKEKLNKIIRALLLSVVMCNVSFEAVGSPLFLYFISQVRPLHCPSSGYLVYHTFCNQYRSSSHSPEQSLYICPGHDVLSGRLLAAEAARATLDQMTEEELAGMD